MRQYSETERALAENYNLDSGEWRERYQAPEALGGRDRKPANLRGAAKEAVRCAPAMAQADRAALAELLAASKIV